MSQLPEAAKEVAAVVDDAATDVTHAAKGAATHAAGKARKIYKSAALKAGNALAAPKEFVQRHPVPVVLGTFMFGVAMGCAIMMARRKPTLGERYADEPLATVREAVLATLAPMTKRFQMGYESARKGSGKAMDQVHRFGPARTGGSFSNRIGRIRNNLKFW